MKAQHAKLHTHTYHWALSERRKHRQKVFKWISMGGITLVLGFEHSALSIIATVGWFIHGAFWLMSE